MSTPTRNWSVPSIFRSLRTRAWDYLVERGSRRPDAARPRPTRLSFEPLENRDLLSGITAITPPPFLNPTTITAGNTPDSIASLTLDSGNKVLLVANYYGNDVSVLDANGSTTFATLTTDSGPNGFAVGDFGNGHQDFAVANYNSNTISVFLGDGTGNFTPAATLTTGTTPANEMVVADFNADGKPDLGVANASDATVSVFLGTGMGTFSAATDYTVGSGSQAVVGGDFFGNGRMDLAVANANDGTVSFLPNNGSGGFGTPTTVTVGSATFYYYLAAGDFDEDGKPDVVLSDFTNNVVHVLANAGSGSFSVTDVAVGSGPDAIAVGDITGSGHLGMMVSNYYDNNVTELLGNGDGTFQTGVSISDGSGSGPNGVVLDDLNGDGNLDIATANQNAGNASVLSSTAIIGTAGQALPHVILARFSDVGGPASASAYAATVTWGDSSSTSTGTVVYLGGDEYAVYGPGHVYSSAGSYSGSVSVDYPTPTGAVAVPFTATIRPSGTISGSIFNDRNASGTQDTGETGLGVWTVQLTDSTGALVGTTQTATDGTFSFSNLAPGTYTAQEVVFPGWTPTAGTGQTFVVSGGTASATFGDYQNTFAHGTLFDDLDGDGLQQSGETGLACETVELYTEASGVLSSSPVQTTTTDAAGNYSFSNLGPLAAGTSYVVAEVIPDQFEPTSPSASDADTFNLPDGRVGYALPTSGGVTLATPSGTHRISGTGTLTVNQFNNGTGATVSFNDGSGSRTVDTLLTQMNATYDDNTGLSATFNTFCIDLSHDVTSGQSATAYVKGGLASAFSNAGRMEYVLQNYGTGDLTSNPEQAAAVQLAIWELSLDHNPTSFSQDADGSYSSGDESVFEVLLGSGGSTATIVSLTNQYLQESVGATSSDGGWFDTSASGTALDRGQSLWIPTTTQKFGNQVTTVPVIAPSPPTCPPANLVTPTTSTQAPPDKSTNPVRYVDGPAWLVSTDLASGGGGVPWGQTRSWSNAPGYATRQTNGSGWVDTQAPRLLQVDGVNTLAVVGDAQTAWFFDLQSDGSYVERLAGNETLAHNTGTDTYTLTTETGDVITFGGFTNSLRQRRGQFESLTTAAGETAAVTSWATNGSIDEVQTTAGSEVESYLYAYVASGANTGLLASVTHRRSTNSGSSWSGVDSVEYAYYDGVESGGNARDLQTATVKDGSGAVVSTDYYRYYTAGEANGYRHGLKYAVTGAAYDLLRTAAGGTDADVRAASDSLVATYANNYFQYDSARHVTEEVASGAGCSVCSGGQGTFDFSYTTSTNAAGANSWAVKTIETLTDGNTNTVYTNSQGEVMLKVYTDAATSQQWSTYYKYDDDGRMILQADPSAVTGYDDSYADLVHFVSGNAQYLSDSTGLITANTYGTTTTATSATPGDVAGYVKETDLQHGETGTAIPQESVNYFERTIGSGQNFFHLASDTVYRNDDGTGGETTSNAYTFATGTNEIISITTTLPAITTAENGSGTADSVTSVFDDFGRPIWSKDQAGFITYLQYDLGTGALVKMIADVDTTQTSTFANLPSGWTTPSGGGRHLVTSYEVDSFGRVTKETTPEGRVNYSVYDNENHEVRAYMGWDSTTNTSTGPTTVTREDWGLGYTETLTMSATPNVSSGRPTGTEAISNVESLSRSYVNEAGQVVHTDDYFNLTGLTYSTAANIGTEGTNFYRTRFKYDDRGLLNKVTSPQGTITRTVYDGLKRPVSEWVGTDDTPTTGYWSPTNLAGTDMVKVRDYEYDNGGVGESNLTKVTDHPGGGASDRVTQSWFDWRDRAVAVKSGVETSEDASVNRPLTFVDYDNLGEVTKTRVYDADGVTPSITGGVPQPLSSSLLRAQSTTDFDELGRAFHSDVYSVDPVAGTVSTNTLHSDTWFDSRGYVIKSASPGGLVDKEVYDGVGFSTVSYMTDGGGDSGYSDAGNVTGDVVLEQSERTFSDDGYVIATTSRMRFHDATGTGALGTPTSGVGARVSYGAAYFDAGGRVVASVDVGTNGGTAWTRPSMVPSRSDTVLVSSLTYDSAGMVYEMTDPRGLVTRTLYDDLGRATTRIENYVDGTVSDSDDKTTTFTYNGSGMTSLTAHLTGGGGQTTEWVYGVSAGTGSAIASNDVVGTTKWPDPTTGSASSSEEETTTVNSLGQPLTMTDRNGSVHSLSYDVLGRVVSDAVTTLGAGVDGSVRRIDTAYDSQGNASLMTSYDAATGGSIVNQVQRVFNGLGQMTVEYQEHGGAVNTSTTPSIQYIYTEMAGDSNDSRLTSMTYPSGYVMNYNYASGLDDSISRLSSISDSTGTLESYDYLGLGTVVRRSHPQTGVDLTYIAASGTGDAGDQYTGLDRFGRVVDQYWVKSGTSVDRFQYGYDRDSNRTTATNMVDNSFSQTFSYDGFNQLTGFNQGSGTHTQAWDYDALGNWDSQTTDGGTPQTRSANKQNEITAISGATTPTYDANGNMTGDDTGKTFVYDAWNRLVVVKSSGGTTLETFVYDGLNRRASQTANGTTTDLLYSGWQVVEEKRGANTSMRYVWSPVYVNAMILRDRDINADGTLDERLWVTEDANWNVTGLVDGSGVVIERYAYDPFGVQTVYDASYTVRSGGSSYGWQYGFQGMRFDATSGLNAADARWYSPTLGRWVSTDPIGFAGGDVNLYGMEGNNPANKTDAMGLSDKPWLDKPWDWGVTYRAAYAKFKDSGMTFEEASANAKAAADQELANRRLEGLMITKTPEKQVAIPWTSEEIIKDQHALILQEIARMIRNGSVDQYILVDPLWGRGKGPCAHAAQQLLKWLATEKANGRLTDVKFKLRAFTVSQELRDMGIDAKGHAIVQITVVGPDKIARVILFDAGSIGKDEGSIGDSNGIVDPKKLDALLKINPITGKSLMTELFK